ncbi:MAG: response regulator transcription factor [Lachnospiraceae bacterium]|nr:response regulator transcription factor [Lachnospiraceae bacterium]
MLNVAVCDDKKDILHNISSLILGEFTRKGVKINIREFVSGRDLLSADEVERYHVVFLDICMEGFDGLQIADIIRRRRKKVKIIFISGHANLVFNSFSCQPYDFIVKESPENMQKKLSRVIERIKLERNQNKTIVLGDIYLGEQTVFYRDIVVIESDRNYLEYTVQDYENPLRIRDTISRAEEVFKPHCFLRVHRKNIVNMMHIVYVDQKKKNIMMDNRMEIFIGESYRKSVTEEYNRYLDMRSGI